MLIMPFLTKNNYLLNSCFYLVRNSIVVFVISENVELDITNIKCPIFWEKFSFKKLKIYQRKYRLVKVFSTQQSWTLADISLDTDFKGKLSLKEINGFMLNATD